MHWQARVGYYWFRKIKAQCETAGGCQMGGFTRILHSGQPDDLMDEIPSIVVDPLPANHDNKGYVVLNRPYAFVQWTQKARIKEKYVLMSEPDHVWLKPMPNLMKVSAWPRQALVNVSALSSRCSQQSATLRRSSVLWASLYSRLDTCPVPWACASAV